MKWQSIPRYDVTTWRTVRRQPEVFTCRPSSVTVMRRLGTTMVVALLLGGLWLTIVLVANRELDSSDDVDALTREFELRTDNLVRNLVEQGVSTESDIEEVRRKSADRLSEMRAKHAEGQARLGRIAWGAASVFALLGLLPPVTTLWNRLTIRRTVRGQLSVSRVGTLPWPKVRQWPILATCDTLVTAQQVVVRFEYGGQRPGGYRWHVRVVDADAAGNGNVMAEFRVHAQAARPEEGGPLPHAVASFLDALEGVMNVPLNRAFNVLDYGDYSRTLVHAAPTVATTSQSYASLDEMPPDVRAKVEQLIGESESGGGRSLPIVYRDSTGREQHFDSIDEMPPDIRAKYEQHIQKRDKR